jgi:hypothetical protein
VALKVHSVVQDAHDFDRAVWRGPVHQEMASATTAPRNVDVAKARHDAWSPATFGLVGELANRLNEGVLIDASLLRAKILGGSSEDVGKVDFRRSAETNAPSPIRHSGSIRRFGR